jgi:hypothetical protein
LKKAPMIAWAIEHQAMVTSPTGARGSGIVCIRPAGDVTKSYQKLQAAGVQCSLREGSIRLSPHLFNTAANLARVGELLVG